MKKRNYSESVSPPAHSMRSVGSTKSSGIVSPPTLHKKSKKISQISVESSILLEGNDFGALEKVFLTILIIISFESMTLLWLMLMIMKKLFVVVIDDYSFLLVINN